MSDAASVVVTETESYVEREFDLRLEDATADPAGTWEYGRLEIFRQGIWTNIQGLSAMASADVACKSLGYDGGASLQFGQPSYQSDLQRLGGFQRSDKVSLYPLTHSIMSRSPLNH